MDIKLSTQTLQQLLVLTRPLEVQEMLADTLFDISLENYSLIVIN